MSYYTDELKKRQRAFGVEVLYVFPSKRPMYTGMIFVDTHKKRKRLNILCHSNSIISFICLGDQQVTIHSLYSLFIRDRVINNHFRDASFIRILGCHTHYFARDLSRIITGIEIKGIKGALLSYLDIYHSVDEWVNGLLLCYEDHDLILKENKGDYSSRTYVNGIKVKRTEITRKGRKSEYSPDGLKGRRRSNLFNCLF